MFIRLSTGELSLVTPQGTRYLLSETAWKKLGSPFALTVTPADYQQYPQAGVINDISLT